MATRQALLHLDHGLARHEAEALLMACLHIDRAQLRLHPEAVVDSTQVHRFQNWLDRYHAGEPLAYLTGSSEFYGLPLKVTADTLVPRPDSEIMVETVLALPLGERVSVADLGTGTGALALALKHQRPSWQVVATDQNAAALEVARQNAADLGLTLDFKHGNWFQALRDATPEHGFELIISNPPYLADDDPHLPDLVAEPLSALVADDHGLADLSTLIEQAPDYLAPCGWLWLEHGYQQARDVQRFLHARGFQTIHTREDYGGNPRVTGGQWRPASLFSHSTKAPN